MSTLPTPKSELPGLNIMLMGPGGTGKTYSLHTLVEAGLEVFVLFTEAGRESLLGYWTDAGKPVPSNLHWCDIRAQSLGFGELADAANDLLNLPPELLFKKPDTHKSKYTAFVDTLRALANFPDARTGQKFGPVDSWGTGRVLVIDSLTGISQFAMQNVTGGKVVRDQSDWGKAQGLLEFFLRKCTDGTRCHFILLAHVEREIDQVQGGVKLMPSTLGKALPPKLSPMFSEVVLTERVAEKWQWSTISTQADTKSRYLGTGTYPQDFRPILEKWKARGGVIESQ